MFKIWRKYSLAHFLVIDLDSRRGIARVFNKLFREHKNLIFYRPTVGKAFELTRDSKIFNLIIKERMDQPPNYSIFWGTLCDLKLQLLRLNISKLAICKIECSRGEQSWKLVRNVLEVLFTDTHIKIVVRSCIFRRRYLPRKTVACYLYNTEHCVKSSTCKYKYGKR